MSDHASVHKPVVKLMHARYGATDVVFSDSGVTMNCKGQSFKCDDVPAMKKLKDRPTFRCVSLTLVNPAAY